MQTTAKPRKPGAAKRARGAPAARSLAAARRGFSMPSFSAGIAVGAVAGAVALLMLDRPVPGAAAALPVADAQRDPPIVFEFWENLPSERVGAVATPAEAAPAATVAEQDAKPPSAAQDAAPAAEVAEQDAAPPPATPDEAADRLGLPVVAPPPLPAAAASSRVGLLVQAGAFRQDAAARKRQAELILAGMEAEIRSMAVDDGVLYRVIVGPFPTRVETRRVMGDLRARHIAPFLITRAVQPG